MISRGYYVILRVVALLGRSRMEFIAVPARRTDGQTRIVDVSLGWLWNRPPRKTGPCVLEGLWRLEANEMTARFSTQSTIKLSFNAITLDIHHTIFLRSIMQNAEGVTVDLYIPRKW